VVHSHKHGDEEEGSKEKYPEDFGYFLYCTQEVFSEVFPEGSVAALLVHASMVHHAA
jgi:hypothetical protein